MRTNYKCRALTAKWLMKTGIKLIVFATLWFLPAFHCRSQTIRGTVFADGEPAFSASVFLKQHAHISTIADEDGHFELALQDGILPDTLLVTYVGYKEYALPLATNAPLGNLTIKLMPNTATIAEVKILADATSSKEFAVTKLTQWEVLTNPSASADPLKAVAMMAYSTPTTESANPELRGSASGYNRVVVNGVPIYNPVRNQQLDGMGNFSLFNADIVGEQFVYPSNPPLEYGNATGGIVNIRTTNAPSCSQRTHLSASLAGIGAFHTSFLMGLNSFAQVYGNLQSSELYRPLNAKGLSHLRHFRSADAGLNLRTQISRGMYINLFSYYINERYAANRGLFNYRGEQNATNKRNFNIVNWAYSVGWKNAFAINFATDAAATHYLFGSITDHTRQFSTFVSATWKHCFTEELSVAVGLDNEYYRYEYDGEYPSAYFLVHPSNAHAYRKSATWMNKTEGYVYGKWQTSKLSIGGGIRQMASKQFSGALSHQANIKYSPNKHNAFIASFGEYNAINRPNYYARAFNKAFSRQLSLDYSHTATNLTWSAALYHKRERLPFLSPYSQETMPIAHRITGVELAGKYAWPHLTAKASYTYLMATTFIDNKWQRAENDFGHTAKLEISYTNIKLFNASLNCLYHPGRYFTPIVGKYDIGTTPYPIYGAYNSEQLPRYISINLALNKYIQVGRAGVVAYLTLTNLLNRTNANYVFYDAQYANKQIEPLQKRLVYFGVVVNL